jgi:signal transduction histidine kinase
MKDQSQQNLLQVVQAWKDNLFHNVDPQKPYFQTLARRSAQFSELFQNYLLTENIGNLKSIIENWESLLPPDEIETKQSLLIEWIFFLQESFQTATLEIFHGDDFFEINNKSSNFFLQAYKLAVLTNLTPKDIPGAIKHELPEKDQTLEYSKSKFITVAAHELKTPLTLIEGYTAMLASKLDLPESAFESTLIKGIEEGSKRLHELIDDLIDVALIDNDMLGINFQPVWLSQIISRLMDETTEICTQRNLKVSLLTFDGINTQTFGDPVRLLQAFRNILNNALKFTPDGGEIRIDGIQLPGFLEINIHDTGIGIPTEEKAKIFERFSKPGNASLHSSSKTRFKGGGPGLGLHIARGIIESHGGAIWIDSPGYDEIHLPGTTVTVVLPIRTSAPDYF